MTPLVEHLWQSTLCVLVAALLAGLLCRSPARTRHAIWLCASLKFLVPLSLFVAAGAQMGTQLAASTSSMTWAASIAPPGLATVVGWLDQSRVFWTIEAMDGAAGRATPGMLRLAIGNGSIGAIALSLTLTSPFLIALVLIWGAGAAALGVWRWRQWRMLSRLAQAATPLHEGRVADALRRVTGGRPPGRTSIGGRLDLLQCESRCESHIVEPGVFGIRRPRLLWPAGLSDRLSDGQLEAIVAHELGHVARRDNLSGLAHMIVETVFWFHPLVWWIGTRLTSERERACDEEVLRMGIDNRDYAVGIVKVSGFCLRAPAALMAGVGGGGSGLAARVERILSRPVLGDPTLTARLLLAGVLAIAAGGPIAAGASSAVQASRSQEDTSPVYRPGDGVTQPTLVHEVKPQYTTEAKQARIQGEIQLEAVVLTTGAVGDVTVVRSLDKVHGLDDEAVTALKQWRFEPGTKDKKPVAVRIEVEMRFTLR